MKKQSEGFDMKDKLTRRVAIKTTAAASIGIAFGAFGDPKGSIKDLIREENAKKGTRDWRLTNTKTVPGKINKILDNGRSKAIEGYCNANSLRSWSAQTRLPLSSWRSIVPVTTPEQARG